MAMSIGVLRSMEPRHMVPIQLKILTPVGTAMSMVVMVKTELAMGPNPTVNIWWLHTAQLHDGDDDTGEHYDRVPEQRFAAEGGYHFGHDAHCRQNQDVDLGVAEEPEQVLPQDRVAAGGGIEEVGAKLPVRGKFDEGHGDDREGQHQQDAGNQVIHTNTGIRIRDIPGARILMMVTTKLKPAASDATPSICRLSAQKSRPLPTLNGAAVRLA